MKATYDPLADAVSITFQIGKVAKTKEVSSGILLDVDKKGNPLYLEVLNASKRFKNTRNDLDKISMIPFSYSKRELVSLGT